MVEYWENMSDKQKEWWKRFYEQQSWLEENADIPEQCKRLGIDYKQFWKKHLQDWAEEVLGPYPDKDES